MDNTSFFPKLYRWLRKTPFWVSFIAVNAIFYDLGFDQSEKIQLLLHRLYTLTLSVGIVSTLVRYQQKKNRPGLKVLLFDIISILFFLLLIADKFELMREANFFDFFPCPR